MNFNAIKYLKQDYFNFKKYINSEFYPRHMDYFNNDCAPDLIRFMNIKIGGKKTCSYYCFLQGIGEEGLPLFMDDQVEFVNYISGMLPLVRPHEYEILRILLDGPCSIAIIDRLLRESIPGYASEQLTHALRFLKGVDQQGEKLSLKVALDDQFKEYLLDAFTYG